MFLLWRIYLRMLSINCVTLLLLLLQISSCIIPTTLGRLFAGTISPSVCLPKYALDWVSPVPNGGLLQGSMPSGGLLHRGTLYNFYITGSRNFLFYIYSCSGVYNG